MPSSFSEGLAATSFASSMTSSVLVTPKRCAPTSTTISTRSVWPAPAAASASSRAWAGSSVTSVRSPSLALSSRRRGSLLCPRIAEVRCRWSSPPAASASASDELGAADPDGTRGELPAGDLDGFVGLGVRPKTDATLGRELRHRRNVRLERIEIENERRRVDPQPVALLPDERPVPGLALPVHPRPLRLVTSPS